LARERLFTPRLRFWSYEEMTPGCSTNVAEDDHRQMVLIILTDVPLGGLDAVEAACQQALAENVCSAVVVLNLLAWIGRL
jgi:hypothetical protein